MSRGSPGDLEPAAFPQLDWSAAAAGASLDQLREHVEDEAGKAAAWYLRKKGKKRVMGRSLRGLAILLGFVAAAYMATGDDAKAHTAMKALLDKKPKYVLSNFPYAYLYKRAEDQDRFRDLLRKAGMPEK